MFASRAGYHLAHSLSRRIDIRDAQNALVRNNVFGAKGIAGVGYPCNRDRVAIRAMDSGRAERPNLFSVDIVGNVVSGEVIKGCEKPDTIVACSGNR